MLDKELDTGLYVEGESILHQLDPRVKFAASLVMVVLSFAASSWWQLLWVVLVFMVTLSLLRGHSGQLWRVLWSLRWLLVFSLLLHLLFTPGRTLLGTRWLSYDGLLSGGLICAQIILSVSFATVYALTTKIEAVVAAAGWFLKPLEILGFDVRNFQGLLLQVLRFLPEVRNHMVMSASGVHVHHVEEQTTFVRRWNLWMTNVKASIMSLIERGDQIAHEMVENENNHLNNLNSPSMLPIALLDRVIIFLLLTILSVYWTIGAFA